MANYGARLAMIATRTESNGAVSFSDGVALGKLIKETVTPTQANAQLYGDDTVAEEVNDVLYATISTNLTGVAPAVEAIILGSTYTEATGETEATLTRAGADECPYVGHGFISAEILDGVKSYVVHFFPKVRFSLPNAEYNTKGNSISYTTPTLSGVAYPEAFDGKEDVWEKLYYFDTATKAVEKLKTLCGAVEAAA